MAQQQQILGTRLGGALSLDNGHRTPPAEVNLTDWVCPAGHTFTVPLESTATRPDVWECRTCGAPATDPESDTPIDPALLRDRRGRNGTPAKTHMDQVRERRTPAEMDALLQDALTRLRARTGTAGAMPPHTGPAPATDDGRSRRSRTKAS